MAQLRSAVAQGATRSPRDHGHLAALDGSYGYLRQFTPQLLAAVRFPGGTAATWVLEAVEILRELVRAAGPRGERTRKGTASLRRDRPAGQAPSR